MREEKDDSSWISAILIAATLMLGAFLLGNDMLCILKWYAVLLLGTLVFLPLASYVFDGFGDVPWFFAKVMGFMIPGYIVWAGCSVKVIKFGNAACISVLVLCALLICVLPAVIGKRSVITVYKGMDIGRVLKRELLFAAALVGYMYIRSFSPDAFGTERMMDYSFMQSLYESAYFPPTDVWFAGNPLNYYYFGQYIFT